MSEHFFIEENFNYGKIKSLVTFAFAIVLITGSIIFLAYYFTDLVNYFPFLTYLEKIIQKDITKLTPLGLFYLTFITELFFIPFPLEPLLIISLNQGHPLAFALPLLLLGIITSHTINYLIASKFKQIISHLISKRKLYNARRWLNKYGAYTIIIFYALPFPAQLLAVGLGLAHYNFKRYFTLMIIGLSIKYGLVTAAYYSVI